MSYFAALFVQLYAKINFVNVHVPSKLCQEPETFSSVVS